MKHYYHFLAIVIAASAMTVTIVSAAERPNILLILADDVGREVLGCYGGQSYKTPNLDRLAHSGIRFEHAYVMAMCHPTRICIMTGQYPFRLGEPTWGTFPKSVEQHTLANVLKRAGYVTGIAGKWQLTLLKNDLAQPNRMGFDEYCLDGWHEGPWYYQPRIWQNRKLREDIRDRYGPDVTCDFLIDFMRRHQHEPFFAYYTMELCHDETNDLDKPAPFGPLGRYENFSEMVTEMDQHVGRVISALDHLKLRDRTIVIFLADNGTPPKTLLGAKNGKYIFSDFNSKMGDRDVRGGKGKLTDWGTRVPMIASWPGKISAGKVSDGLIDGSDILPSLAEIGGAPLPHELMLDGHSFAGVLKGGTTTRDWVFAENNGLGCVRDRRWKLYSNDQFFDLASDIDEAHPIAKSELTDESRAAYQRLKLNLDHSGFSKAQEFHK
jgi:arylsulfatase A